MPHPSHNADLGADPERNPIDEIAEEFVERYRHGERPTVTEYCERFPAFAEQIRALIPALVLMERVRPLEGDDLAAGEGDGLRFGGRTLERLGDFRILREIGRGGMGIVYEAEQESLGRHVALKVLSAGAVLETRQLKRFQREAKAAARLHHTNIVPVFGVGEQDGLQYYVMQFIAGQGLDEVLIELKRLRKGVSEWRRSDHRAKTSRPATRVAEAMLSGAFGAAVGPSEISEASSSDSGNSHSSAHSSAHQDLNTTRTIDRTSSSSSSIHLPGQSDTFALSESGHRYFQSIARIALQVADALAYAHAQGVLHRDVKPSNLLLDLQGTVWITDFGLAKATDSDDITHSGDIVGTLRYMAPERFSGRDDARSDIYSLGLTLYELLTLRPAFADADRSKLIQRVIHEEPVRPRRLEPAIPRDLETIVLKAIAREPARRFQSAALMAEDLKRFVEDRPIRARRVGQLERSWRWCRRNPLVAALTVAVIAILMVGSSVSTHFAIRRKGAEANAALAELKAKQATTERAAADRHRYYTTMLLTQRAWKDAQTERVIELLDAVRPERTAGQDLRGFEWYYWQRLCYDSLLTLNYHKGRVYCVAFSPDNQQIASGGEDRTVRICDAMSGRELHTLYGHSAPVWGLSFSRDGKRLATSSDDCTVRIWDLQLGTEIRRLEGHSDSVTDLSFSPDGQWLASAGEDCSIRLWHRLEQDEPRILLGHSGPVWSVAWNPNGMTLASASDDGTVKVWDAIDGRELRTLRGHTRFVYAVAFDPSGELLATGADDDLIRIWSTDSWDEKAVLRGHTRGVRALQFSPDASRLASGSRDGTIRIWQRATGQELLTLKGHRNQIDRISLSNDGRKIASASRDGTVRVWDLTNDQLCRTLRGHSGAVVGTSFSPSGDAVASSSLDGTVKIWATDSSEVLSTLHAGENSKVAFAPDGQRFACSSDDYSIKVRNRFSGELLCTLRGHSATVHAMGFSVTSDMIASASEDGTVRIWNLSSGEQITAIAHAGPTYDVTFSPDGTKLALGAEDMIRLCDVTSGEELFRITGDAPVYSVTFSPDGKRLASCHSMDVRVWDVSNGQELLTLKGHTSIIKSVAFSPDGNRLASASHDFTVKIWDTTEGHDGQELLTLEGHTDMVFHVVFSRDGKRLASAGHDGTIRLWTAGPGK